MNIELAILVFGVLASLIQALSFFLLKQIFNELKSIRETFRDYVPKDMCEVKMDGHHLRIKDIEDSLHLVLIAGGCLLLAGCGHNTISYGDGIMLETTINPESYAFGISFRYGKILTACVRENAEVEMQGAGSGNAGTGKENTAGATSTGSVKVRIGKQITGYYVDAVKAGVKPEELRLYTDEEKAASVQSAGQDKNTVSTTATSNKE